MGIGNRGMAFEMLINLVNEMYQMFVSGNEMGWLFMIE